MVKSARYINVLILLCPRCAEKKCPRYAENNGAYVIEYSAFHGRFSAIGLGPIFLGRLVLASGDEN
ncbi:hypothetical protein COO20_18150 [Thalassospira marina]|uniref:Uncharacterized protein n=1 Tax=Thalassospira marina TaxID=2048283 RepID=A0A2N3KMR2_9PROT|nr:hypothetical protein COO20_18150 [Thalassospira marina]